MDYKGSRTEEGFIRFISSVNQKESLPIERIADVEKLVFNSTDKFFINFATKVHRLNDVFSLYSFMVNNNPNFSGLLSAFPFSEKTDTQSVCVFLFNIILL